MSKATPMSQKHCGNMRVKYCECGHDKKRHCQGYSGANTGHCKSYNCKCEEYSFGKQVVYQV